MLARAALPFDFAAEQCFILAATSGLGFGDLRMRRFLVLGLLAAMLAGCQTLAQERYPTNTPQETSAVLGELANGPAPGLPPTAAGAAIGNQASGRCFGIDRFGMRVRTPC